MTETPIHPDMIPDNDPRTVEEIASDAGLDPQPISLLDRITKMRQENKDSTGPKPRSAKRDSIPRRPRMRSSSSEVPPFVEGYLTEHLTKFYGNIGMMVGMFDPTCGSTVVMNAKQMAESMEKLAETSPGTRKFLMSLVSTSALAEVVAAHMPVVMAIAMHHTSAGQRLSMMMPQNPPESTSQGE